MIRLQELEQLINFTQTYPESAVANFSLWVTVICAFIALAGIIIAVLSIIYASSQYKDAQKSSSRNIRDKNFLKIVDGTASNDVKIRANAITSLAIFSRNLELPESKEVEYSYEYDKAYYKTIDPYLHINSQFVESVNILLNTLMDIPDVDEYKSLNDVCRFSLSQFNDNSNIENINIKREWISRKFIEYIQSNYPHPLNSITLVKVFKRNLDKIDFRDIWLYGSDLYSCNFQKADFQKANLARARLKKCNFSYANLNDSIFTLAYMRQVNLKGAEVREANFIGVNLNGSDLSDIKASESDFAYANFSETKVINSNLENSCLIAVRFDDARLDNANFNNADLRLSDLSKIIKKNKGAQKSSIDKGNLYNALIPNGFHEFFDFNEIYIDRLNYLSNKHLFLNYDWKPLNKKKDFNFCNKTITWIKSSLIREINVFDKKYKSNRKLKSKILSLYPHKEFDLNVCEKINSDIKTNIKVFKKDFGFITKRDKPKEHVKFVFLNLPPWLIVEMNKIRLYFRNKKFVSKYFIVNSKYNPPPKKF